MWRIDRDYLNTGKYADESRVGHHEEHSRIPVVAAMIGLESEELPSHAEDGTELPLVRFRLKDDDGEVYFGGELHDDDECLNQSAALSYGEGDAGCTTIEVKRDNEWVLEIG